MLCLLILLKQKFKMIVKWIFMPCFLFSTFLCYSQNTNPVTDVIFKLKEGGNISDEILNIINQYKAVEIKKLLTGKNEKQSVHVIQFPLGTNIYEIVEQLNKIDEVEYSEPDFKAIAGGKQMFAPNDQYYFRQWALKNNGTFSLSPSVAGADMDMENAWNIEKGDSNVIVAVIDGGTYTNHPEFSGRIWINQNEIPNNNIDDDNNGLTDDVRGWNFAYNNNNHVDEDGHGTNVAGIIGAVGNNSNGYSGVDLNCKLMISKVLDSTNQGSYSWMASAIYYSVDNGAKVINMSMGGDNFSATLENAVNYALSNNVVFVACMMNTNSQDIFYPAGHSGVIAVGATNPNDSRSAPFFWDTTSGSNYGNHISVVAPGNYIFGLHFTSDSNFGTYWGGTSQAAPHVAGLAALLLAQNPNRAPSEIKSIIETTAEDRVGISNEDTPGWDKYYGHGRVNAYRALANITTVGAENSVARFFSVFPNPTNGIISIQLADAVPAEINIYNKTGQNVCSFHFESEYISLDKSLPSGIYFLQVKTADTTEIQKLILL